MNEILPGIFHWKVVWPEFWSLESYYIRTDEGSVIIDPIECIGLNEIDEDDNIQAVIVTVGWHERSARLFAKRTRAPLFVPTEDAHRFEDLEGFISYEHGYELPCELTAIGVPGLTPGEHALLSHLHGGSLFVGDALGTTAKWAPGDTPLGAHPNGHPQPAETLSHLLDFRFENIMPGHGDPLIGNGRTELEKLIQHNRCTTSAAPRVTWVPGRRLNQDGA